MPDSSHSDNQPPVSSTESLHSKAPQLRQFQQWYHQQTKLTKFGLGCGVLFVIMALCIGSCMGEIAIASRIVSNTIIQATIPTRIALAITPAAPASPTSVPTATPTSASTQVVVTYGRPRLGGPLSDFVGKYGVPTVEGSFTDGDIEMGPQTDDNNIVQSVTAGPCNNCSSWGLYQARDYCLQFMPPKAVPYKGDGQNLQDLIHSPIYFSSSIGRIGLTVEPTYCVLWIDNNH